MSLTFPADSTTQAAVSRGSGKLYFAPSTVAGVDPTTISEFGPTSGGIEIDGKRTLAKIECDQYLGPIGAFPSGEDWQVKTSFLHDNFSNHYNAWGTLGAETVPANVLTGGTLTTPAGSLTFGESSARRYVQLLWKGPGPGDLVTLSYQFWKCVPIGPGSWKFTKNKERVFQMVWQCVCDPAALAAGRGAVGYGVAA
jgi:hypothetical protein